MFQTVESTWAKIIRKSKQRINVEKNKLKKLKFKKKEGKKRKISQNCKIPMERQRFITTVKNLGG